jgi:hypothetical protein
MNRRNAIKAAIGGIAAACGWKAAKAGPTVAFRNWFWGRVDSVGYFDPRAARYIETRQFTHEEIAEE